MIKPEKQPRRKYHKPSKVNIAASNLFFLCVYIDYNEQEASFKEKEEDRYQGASGSIQLPEMNYFISKAEHHGGDEK